MSKEQNIDLTRLSQSSLKAFAKSPSHFIQYKTEEYEATPAQEFGSMVHKYVLEHDQFDEAYILQPKFDRRTKQGKEDFANFQKEAKGKKTYTADQLVALEEIYANVLAHPVAGNLLKLEGEVEKHLEVEHKVGEHNLTLHGYLDKYSHGRIIELKTGTDTSPERFQRDAYNLKYHWQAGFYTHLASKHFNIAKHQLEFFYITVDTKAPYNVTVYKADLEFVLRGLSEIFEVVERYTKWDGEPAGYSEKILGLGLPSWAK